MWRKSGTRRCWILWLEINQRTFCESDLIRKRKGRCQILLMLCWNRWVVNLRVRHVKSGSVDNDYVPSDDDMFIERTLIAEIRRRISVEWYAALLSLSMKRQWTNWQRFSVDWRMNDWVISLILVEFLILMKWRGSYN